MSQPIRNVLTKIMSPIFLEIFPNKNATQRPRQAGLHSCTKWPAVANINKHLLQVKKLGCYTAIFRDC
ncbi:hypothetical protein Hdeb2414_s0011g00364721 [Helianthus debilis subsp. tardiflorus]